MYIRLRFSFFYSGDKIFSKVRVYIVYILYIVLYLLLQHRYLSASKMCLFWSFNLKIDRYSRDLEHQ